MIDMKKSITEADKFRQWADGYLNFEKTPQKNIFWLNTMQYICDQLNNPQNSAKAFHIAGSKGKGSVSEMIASVLAEAGYSTGIYTSPHIIDFAERIVSTDGFFSDEVYRKSADTIIKTISNLKKENLPGERAITWFELATLYGMECFRNAGCQWAVYEVGLGGRLDATNVIKPECCCINRIEKEHTEFLGDTLEQIAAEKGGIIKPDVPVVIGKQSSEKVDAVFNKIAKEKNSKIVFAQEHSKIYDTVYNFIHTNDKNFLKSSRMVQNNRQAEASVTMDFCLESDFFSRPLNLSLKMLGEFQADNASLAAIAVKTVFPDLDESVIEKGLSQATLPGRFEIINDVPGYPELETLVLDGAHTPSSIGFTLDTFKKICGQKNPHLLFACASDKDVENIAPLFKDKFGKITLTIPGTTKSSNLERAETAFRNCGLNFRSSNDYAEAIKKALRQAAEEGSPLLITGSFYLVSEVKKVLLSQPT